MSAGEGESCRGCVHMVTEDAGKQHLFYICTLGKFEECSRPVFDYLPAFLNGPMVPIPAWCKLGKGKEIQNIR